MGLKIFSFIVGVVGLFAYIGNSIPQIKSGPVEVVSDIGETPEALVRAGRKIFMSDRAQCLTCHSIGEDPKARCPNQEGLGARAGKRRSGYSAAEYLIESAYNPNAFVVQGYPRNQMKPVHKPPIALSHDEILAALSFLNTLGGETNEAFVEQLRKAQAPWRKGLLRPDEDAGKQDHIPILPGDPKRGRAVLIKQDCLRCHRIGREGKDICPDLTVIAASQSAEYILESILEPNAVIVKGYKENIIVWEDEDAMELRGIVRAWIPGKEHPKKIKLSVVDEHSGKTVDRIVDLSKVKYIGDMLIGLATDDEEEEICGEHVKGDEKSGLTIRILKNGAWTERRIEAADIDFAEPAISPMPSNFGQLMTPRELYDLIAYLSTLKGKQ